jgi:hypothetical protein
MKSSTCTATDIAWALRLSLDELYEVIKQHPDFPEANSVGRYSNADVFAFVHRRYKQDRLASLRLKNFGSNLH